MTITKEVVSNIGGGKVLEDDEFIDLKKLKKRKNSLTTKPAEVNISTQRSS